VLPVIPVPPVAWPVIPAIAWPAEPPVELPTEPPVALPVEPPVGAMCAGAPEPPWPVPELPPVELVLSGELTSPVFAQEVQANGAAAQNITTAKLRTFMHPSGL
jgi:hypothetical protein